MIYIVLQGSVRSCTLLEREEFSQQRRQAQTLSKTYDYNEDLNDRVREEKEDDDNDDFGEVTHA